MIVTLLFINHFIILGIPQSRLTEFIEDIYNQITKIVNLYKFTHEIYGIAITFFHYYTYFKNLKEIDPLELSIACIYLACKNQYFLIPMDKVMEMYNKAKMERKDDLSGTKVPDFLKYEIEIYSFLGYDDLNIETPYFWYYKIVGKFSYLGESKIKNVLFNIIKDAYRKALCLFYHPRVIMFSALAFTIKFLEINTIKMENIIQGENAEEIAECMNKINEIYDISK